MKTFKQFMKEGEAYGWLNPKGSFIRNRNGNRHSETYTKKTGIKKDDHFDTVDHAIKKGWHRIDLRTSDNAKEVDGIIQGRVKKWTPRHDRAIKRIKKALGASGYRDISDKIREK